MLSRINIIFLFLSVYLLNTSLLAQEYSFSSPIQLNASRCKSITTADLNKDNAADIIVGTFNPDKINIFLNDGIGNFNTNADFTYPASSRPVGIAVADFNEDNNLDIITANYIDSTLSIFWGSGDGSFNDSDTLKISQKRAVDIAIAYLNGDSHLDLAVVTQDNTFLLVLTGNGDGTFNNAIEYTTSGSPEDLKIADFDNDLDMDIAVGNGGESTFYIHYNDGAGDFSNKIIQNTPAGPPTFLEVGFMNADLYPDIVTAKGGVTVGSLDILLNDQAGNFSQSSVVTPGGYLRGLYLARIDTNAFLDAVSINNSGLYISFGDGAGDFTKTDTVTSFTTESPQTLFIDDFNSDNFNDIVVCNDYSVYIFMQTDNATFVEDQPNTTPDEFKLEQNYPNPFNPTTQIFYQIASDVNVNLTVFNMLGEVVDVLINDQFTEAGQHSVRFDASNPASGIYFYRLQAGNFVQTRKMTLVK